MKKFWNNRRFKYGSMATLVTVLFVVGVVVVNIIATLLLNRFPVKVDLTDNKIYQLTEESIDFAKKLDTPVEIIVCKSRTDLEDSVSSGQPFGKQAIEIIEGYTKQNSNIQVEYVDLVKQPSVAQEYASYGVTDYSVIVKTDKRTKVVSVNDFIDVQTNSQTNQQSIRSQAEQVMTSALMYVTNDKVSKVSILTGFSEVASSGFNSLLKDNNFEIIQQNLSTEEIDPEADVAVIYCPTIDYTDDELQKLDTFLDNNSTFGKTLVYLAAPQQPELPKLESFLAEWGISIQNSRLVESSAQNSYDRTGAVFGATYVNQDYVSDLRDSSLPFIAYDSRPVSLLFTEEGNRSAELLLRSSNTTVAVPLTEEALAEFDFDKAEQQSYGVAALGQRIKYDGTTPLISNVLVFGSIQSFSEYILSDARYNNNEYTVNLVNQLAGKENDINISSVSFDATALTVTQQQYQMIFVLFIIVVPIILVVVGVFVWIRRRNK